MRPRSIPPIVIWLGKQLSDGLTKFLAPTDHCEIKPEGGMSEHTDVTNLVMFTLYVCSEI